MKNKIVLEAETELKDNELREWVKSLLTRVDTINDRTKKHTIEINELRKMVRAKDELKTKN